MIGATSPMASAPGTIRGDLAITVENNVVHGSDSVENASQEILLWFGKSVTSWKKCDAEWVY
jgi:nucleoside-diphosphate kinase